MVRVLIEYIWMTGTAPIRDVLKAKYKGTPDRGTAVSRIRTTLARERSTSSRKAEVAVAARAWEMRDFGMREECLATSISSAIVGTKLV
jgi:hypothetical protein